MPHIILLLKGSTNTKAITVIYSVLIRDIAACYSRDIQNEIHNSIPAIVCGVKHI
jgi:hypothetical protein